MTLAAVVALSGLLEGEEGSGTCFLAPFFLSKPLPLKVLDCPAPFWKDIIEAHLPRFQLPAGFPASLL